jgi:hypothetical protein
MIPIVRVADRLPPTTLHLSLGAASDKCGIESECLSFGQYVTAAQELWMQHRGSADTTPKITSIVVTSESKQIIGEQATYIFNQSSTAQQDHFPARFITNHLDVAQDTGYLEDISGASTFTADQAMLSAISSLKLQLMTRVTVGNCCSNFHLLLKDLLDAGCGASFDNTFQCLQDHENPDFRVCCAWDKSPECQARWIRRIES